MSAADIGRIASPDDLRLVAMLRAGDEEAFAGLVRMYDRALRRLARMFVSTDASAGEVVQEVWIAVLTGLDRFEGRSSLRTWIFRIATNIAKTRGVRESRSVPLSSLGGDDDEDRRSTRPGSRRRPTPAGGRVRSSRGVSTPRRSRSTTRPARGSGPRSTGCRRHSGT